jgi:hypothetical protein
MEQKYKSLDNKTNKLAQAQNQKPVTKTEFFPRVVNKTQVKFTDEEMNLLNKGLKYNLRHKKKQWLSNLA